mgnify:CR=1 FL=1
MGNITMVDGHVPDGSYQNVTANGSCSCDAGMRFDGLRARGSFDAMGLDGGNVHCEGRLICRGDMHVNRSAGMANCMSEATCVAPLWISPARSSCRAMSCALAA